MITCLLLFLSIVIISSPSTKKAINRNRNLNLKDKERLTHLYLIKRKCFYLNIFDQADYSRNGGGGVKTEESTQLSLFFCSFINNFANANGGAIYDSQTRLIIRNCTFCKNIALINGGAIFHRLTKNIYKSLTIINSVFVKNAAKFGKGGALCANFSNELELINNNFTFNEASSGSTLYLRNTIVRDFSGISTILLTNNVICFDIDIISESNILTEGFFKNGSIKLSQNKFFYQNNTNHSSHFKEIHFKNKINELNISNLNSCFPIILLDFNFISGNSDSFPSFVNSSKNAFLLKTNWFSNRPIIQNLVPKQFSLCSYDDNPQFKGEFLKNESSLNRKHLFKNELFSESKILANNKVLLDNQVLFDTKILSSNKVLSNSNILSDNNILSNNKISLNNKIFTEDKILLNNKILLDSKNLPGMSSKPVLAAGCENIKKEFISIAGNILISNTCFNGMTDLVSLGACIYCSNCEKLLVDDCNFISNSGTSGGCIYLYYSSITMAGSVFLSNSAMEYGGCLFLKMCSCYMTDCVFNESFSGYSGSCIFDFAPENPTLPLSSLKNDFDENSSFSSYSSNTNNRTFLFAITYVLKIKNVTFANNQRSCVDYRGDDGIVYIDDCVFLNNNDMRLNIGACLNVVTFQKLCRVSVHTSTFISNLTILPPAVSMFSNFNQSDNTKQVKAGETFSRSVININQSALLLGKVMFVCNEISSDINSIYGHHLDVIEDNFTLVIYDGCVCFSDDGQKTLPAKIKNGIGNSGFVNFNCNQSDNKCFPKPTLPFTASFPFTASATLFINSGNRKEYFNEGSRYVLPEIAVPSLRIIRTIFSNIASSSSGGCIYFESCKKTQIQHCKFNNIRTNNNGGAVACVQSEVNFFDSIFENCSSTLAGGAIYFGFSKSYKNYVPQSYPKFENKLGQKLLFYYNEKSYNIRNSEIEPPNLLYVDNVGILNCHFIKCKSLFCGGAFFFNNQILATIEDCRFENNSANVDGNSIYANGLNDFTLKVSRTTFIKDIADANDASKQTKSEILLEAYRFLEINRCNFLFSSPLQVFNKSKACTFIRTKLRTTVVIKNCVYIEGNSKSIDTINEVEGISNNLFYFGNKNNKCVQNYTKENLNLPDLLIPSTDMRQNIYLNAITASNISINLDEFGHNVNDVTRLFFLSGYDTVLPVSSKLFDLNLSDTISFPKFYLMPIYTNSITTVSHKCMKISDEPRGSLGINIFNINYTVHFKNRNLGRCGNNPLINVKGNGNLSITIDSSLINFGIITVSDKKALNILTSNVTQLNIESVDFYRNGHLNLLPEINGNSLFVNVQNIIINQKANSIFSCSSNKTLFVKIVNTMKIGTLAKISLSSTNIDFSFTENFVLLINSSMSISAKKVENGGNESESNVLPLILVDKLNSIPKEIIIHEKNLVEKSGAISLSNFFGLIYSFFSLSFIWKSNTNEIVNNELLNNDEKEVMEKYMQNITIYNELSETYGNMSLHSSYDYLKGEYYESELIIACAASFNACKKWLERIKIVDPLLGDSFNVEYSAYCFKNMRHETCACISKRERRKPIPVYLNNRIVVAIFFCSLLAVSFLISIAFIFCDCNYVKRLNLLKNFL